ncbi:MAG TPA: hypothetical protein VFU94_08395, partial [Conexibacter sp.]|nr:hypothetical protein [Conexibacter sp.]
GPQRDGDVLALMRGLRREGVTRLASEDRGDVAQINDHHFEGVGLIVLAQIAGLGFEGVDPAAEGATVAHLIRSRSFDGSSPCTRLGNGTAVWVQVNGRDACP